jgi:hypothetical protein
MPRGRIFTVFDVECRFGLALGRPFLLQSAGKQAAVLLSKESAPLEFIDPTNSLSPAFRETADRPFSLSKPVALPDTKEIFVQALTMVNRDIDFKSPKAVRAALADANLLVIFEPLGAAASVRSRLSTQVAIAVECKQAEWEALPKGTFDESFAEIWNEFVRTYHMVTADVRPPFWDDGHRLVIVKQGFVAYGPNADELSWEKRLALPCPAIPVDRHRVVSSYAQEGTFQFNKVQADAVMRRYLREGQPVPLCRETLAGAQRAADLHRSGKTAVIECTIALEIAVAEVVNAAKLKGGVSRKKLDEYKKEVGLGYQLNVDLPLTLSPLSDEERGIIGAADAIRRQRNQIVHEGAQPTREEGQKAVVAVRALLDFLRSRGYKV